MNKSDFGIIGMGVMGRSLAKNVANNGYALSVYNRLAPSEEKVIPNFLKEVNNPQVKGFTDLNAFVNSLTTPRKILLMVNAGAPVDMVIEQLLPFLSEDDILVDGGNSHFTDTQRRDHMLESKGVFFLGTGISGGEQGALKGPSMMVGGDIKAYKKVKDIFESISAKDRDGNPCVALVGSDGCGHFVKTIHNGIEYSEMQLLAECYDVLRATHSYEEIAAILREWNTGELQSYLLEITSEILVKKEGDDYLLDKVLDKAGSKGTGSWSSQAALQLGVPASMINSAVTARYISALKNKRMALAEGISRVKTADAIDIQALKKAYGFARILNHYQGFEIIKAAAKENEWKIHLSDIARIWTQGCIIKSHLMERLVQVFTSETDLLHHDSLFSEVKDAENHAVNTIKYALNNRISISCITESYNYFVSITSAQTSAHMIQAQRDEFGAHTYQRIDRPEDQSFTSNWTSNG